MKKMKHTLIASALLLCGVAAFGQDFSTGYFLEGYTYSYRMNPALRPSRSFLALPGISNFSANLHGNVGIDSFYFPLDNGKLGTFRNAGVSSSEFLGGLPEKPKASLDVTTNALAFGFKTGDIFHTVDVNVRSVNGLSTGKDLFRYIKDGAEGTIDIPKLNFDNQTFVEVAYGMSRPIGDIVVFGARLKLLAGAEMLHADVSDIRITNNGESETINAKGTLTGAIKGMEVITGPSSDGSANDVVRWDDLHMEDIDGAAGFGAALDLGVEVKALPGLYLSAAITDLGGIGWKAPLNAETGATSWETESTGTFDTDGIIDMMEFHQKGQGNLFKFLPTTLRLGAEYKLSDKIGFGALATQRFGPFSLTELRGSANAFVGKFLGFSASAAYSNYGFSWGAALNIDARAFDFFLGFDSIPTRFSTQWIPLGTGNVAATFGLVITFGKRAAFF